jgi:hypothetical protein
MNTGVPVKTFKLLVELRGCVPRLCLRTIPHSIAPGSASAGYVAVAVCPVDPLTCHQAWAVCAATWWSCTVCPPAVPVLA